MKDQINERELKEFFKELSFKSDYDGTHCKSLRIIFSTTKEPIFVVYFDGVLKTKTSALNLAVQDYNKL